MVDALLALLAEGADINHDMVAQRSGVARRTVYRYFPDREALMRSAWEQVTADAGAQVGFPETEAQYLSSMPAIFRGFDEDPDTFTLLRTTPHGRSVRLSQRDRRVAAYSAALADITGALPAADRRLATAMLQTLHTTPWLEMRDQWGLDADEIARACGWAARALLADLRRRGGRSLDAGIGDEEFDRGREPPSEPDR